MAFWEDKSRVVAKRLPTFRLPRRSGGRKRGYRPASFGKRQENGPLIYSTVYKSFIFTLLVAVFHVLEHAIKGLVHGEGLAGAFAALRDRGIAELLALGLVYSCALLPFFALREIRRVLGERRLADLFFRSSASAGLDQPVLRR